MLPTAYPFSEETLFQLWQRFMSHGQCEAVREDLPDPAVIQSWRRCVSRLDPRAAPRPNRLQPAALKAVLNSQQDFVTVATPFLEDIHQFVEGSDCAILLADGTACVLEMVGDRAALDRLEAAGLGQGVYWAEGQLGTNALGMCLITAMPVQVVGPEHYYRDLHTIVSTAAPIHAVNGRIIGIIAVVCPLALATSHTLSLVMAVARAISNQLQTDWFLEEANRRLSEVSTLLAAMHEGVIAWNDQDVVTHCNEQAGTLLGLVPSSVNGRLVTDILAFSPVVDEAVHQQTVLRDLETWLKVGPRTIPLLVNLRPVLTGNGQTMGFILMFRSIARVRRLVQQQFGADAQLTLADFAGDSKPMRRLLRQAETAAKGTAPVLLLGEAGVGKNWLAQAIHNARAESDRPFIAINCRAIPHEKMTAEFLGYEADAAGYGRPSKFELAEGGTLLLDQVEHLSLEMQAALLHVIETHQVLRLNGTYPIPVMVRIMATTSVDLAQYVADGRFLSQLYYRFGVFKLRIPPLRYRKEDILPLANRFLQRSAERDCTAVALEPATASVLQAYPWPGNVRELESVLERACSQCTGHLIRVTDLPDVVRHGRVIEGTYPQPLPVVSIASAEREAIMRAGWSCQGRVSEMAQQLGIGRTTLWRKMKRLNISPEEFKRP